LGHIRVNVIPFNIEDHGAQENTYIYMVKNRFRKGGNRLCTTLHAACRRSKFSGTGSAAARRVVFIGDNFSENKCNTILAFLCDLVHRGWYDEVELVFGPVGHTHNGNDGVHWIHNQLAGNFNSGSLMHYVQQFQHAWASDRTRPDAVLLDTQYNWDKSYAPFLDPLGGFTNTQLDPNSVSAFRACRGESGVVEIRWKTHAHHKEWLGVSGLATGPGFVIMKGFPTTMPETLAGRSRVMRTADFNVLTGKKMNDCMEAAGLEDAIPWIKEAGQTGTLPKGKLVAGQEKADPARWGKVYAMLGGNGVSGEMEVMEPTEATTAKEFWALPAANILAIREHADRMVELKSVYRDMPEVGYARQKRPQRPVSKLIKDGKAAEAKEAAADSDGAADSDDQHEGKHDSREEDGDGQQPQEQPAGGEEDKDPDQQPAPQVVLPEAPWEDLKVGHVAVVRMQWDGDDEDGEGGGNGEPPTKGLDFITIKSLDEDAKTFTGVLWQCTVEQKKQRMPQVPHTHSQHLLYLCAVFVLPAYSTCSFIAPCRSK
jgi:hypothetical protein